MDKNIKLDVLGGAAGYESASIEDVNNAEDDTYWVVLGKIKDMTQSALISAKTGARGSQMPYNEWFRKYIFPLWNYIEARSSAMPDLWRAWDTTVGRSSGGYEEIAYYLQRFSDWVSQNRLGYVYAHLAKEDKVEAKENSYLYKSTDVVGWTTPDGDVVCPRCAAGEDTSRWNPIFAGSEWDYKPTCSWCGARIEAISVIKYEDDKEKGESKDEDDEKKKKKKDEEKKPAIAEDEDMTPTDVFDKDEDKEVDWETATGMDFGFDKEEPDNEEMELVSASANPSLQPKVTLPDYLKRENGTPKRDGSGGGMRLNQGRGGCDETMTVGRGRMESGQESVQNAFGDKFFQCSSCGYLFAAPRWPLRCPKCGHSIGVEKEKMTEAEFGQLVRKGELYGQGRPDPSFHGNYPFSTTTPMELELMGIEVDRVNDAPNPAILKLKGEDKE